MQYYPYNSRDKLYKSIFGAVSTGEQLSIRLLLHNDAKVHNAYILIRNDLDNSFNEIELSPADWVEDYRKYEITTSFNEGLYWYYFRYTSDYGEFFVKKTEHSLGCVTNDGKPWQLTVYDRNSAFPLQYSGGIIYQIFPDRFYNSGTEKENVPLDRFIQKNWSALPEHRQNNGLCSLGNDYFCGDIKGITEKLPYLKSLGITLIYINPIFEAHSNHRYNTADYSKIDTLLGNEDDLKNLCKLAQKSGIGIILDGVFSHTGSDSIYFNKENRYKEDGAYNSQNSMYSSWFTFDKWPDKYKSWWGIDTLPETNESDRSYSEFITGENGIIEKWMNCGISGWRLDVADELPDDIIDKIRIKMKSINPDSILLGEVWEDASNKVSHGFRRRFLRGKQLDSVMNYPFYEAIMSFIKGGDAPDFLEKIISILENYPKPAVDLLMNHIGTHDTLRAITRLAVDEYPKDRNEQANFVFTDEMALKGKKLLKLAAVLQYTLPGIPSLYYGDEAGLTGFADPFCRATYPWGNEDNDLICFYEKLGQMRADNVCFKNGEFVPVSATLGSLSYMRTSAENSVFVAVNRWCQPEYIKIPEEFYGGKPLFDSKINDGYLEVPPQGFEIICIKKSGQD